MRVSCLKSLKLWPGNIVRYREGEDFCVSMKIVSASRKELLHMALSSSLVHGGTAGGAFGSHVFRRRRNVTQCRGGGGECPPSLHPGHCRTSRTTRTHRTAAAAGHRRPTKNGQVPVAKSQLPVRRKWTQQIDASFKKFHACRISHRASEPPRATTT